MRRFLTCFAALFLSNLISAARAVEYHAVVIGQNASAYGINNSNQITGRLGTNPIIWEGISGVTKVLSAQGIGFDINESGHVAVGDFDSSSPYVSRYWDSVNTPTQIPTLGGADCRAEAINSQDQIAGYSRASDGHYRSFIWTREGGICPLGQTSSGDFAYGINDAGQVVGAWNLGDGGLQAFVWSESQGFKALPTLGGWSGSASGINNQGQVVGRSVNGQGWRATLWDTAGVPHDLGVLDGRQSAAFAISDNGSVIGQIEDMVDYKILHPFVWDSVDGMRTLPEVEGYRRCWVQDINDEGWIVGTAQKGPEGGYRSDAVVWIPVPEPSSLPAIALALSVLRRRT